MSFCPRCKISLIKGDRGNCCTSCGFEIPYVFRGYRLSDTDITNLVTNGSTGVLNRWQTKDAGRRISGTLLLTEEFRLKFTAERVTYANCPRCKQGLYRFSHGIMCSSCDFTFFKKMASKKLKEREMMQLLVYRRTEMLHRFVSKETGKYFSARIIIDNAGDIQLEFK